MPSLDPNQQFEKLKEKLLPSIEGLFPIVGRTHTLKLNRTWIEDNRDYMDIDSQKDTKLRGRTWSVPVYASFSLVDNETKKTLDTVKKMRIISLPKVTHRFSYIINGKEYQTLTQFLRRPGVYAQVAQNGELVSQFNLARKGGADNFDIRFDPSSRLFSMKYRNSDTNIKLYPVLKALGVSDATLEDQWGKQILDANIVTKPTPEYKKLHRVIARKPMTSDQAAIDLIRDVMDNTVLDPDTTEITLGKRFEKVGGDTMVRASAKLLSISRNEVPEDDMHSLVFKRTHSLEDFIPERIQKTSREIKRRIFNNLDRKTHLEGIMSLDILNRPVQTFFTSASLGLSFTPEQVNPLEMISGQTKTTIMGAGGIGSEFQITRDEKSINPSHLGFLDPVQTPESSRIGASLSLPLAAQKKGTELFTSVYDMKTGKTVLVRPNDVFNNLTIFPDQVKWVSGKPKPVSGRIKAAYRGNIEEVPLKQARYILKSAKGLFGVSTNLIPFIQNNMGTRAMTASRQQEQAISLLNREAPLVQSEAGKGRSFENILGNYAAHTSPIEGRVVSVRKNLITIRNRRGQVTRVPLYDDYPLNDDKSFLDSTPLVKKGDTVKAGQVIADTNYTKGGVLSLGTNLRTAYVPYRGYNFEDGIVVSDTASKKLTSVHLHRVELALDERTSIGKNKFLAYRRKDLPKAQADKLDNDGVVKVGQMVGPGDMLIAALQRRDGAREAALLTKISRGRITPFRNASLTWDEEHSGKVVNVVRNLKTISVFVKTLEPTQVGDKIVGRHGNKGIVTLVLPDHEMPHDAKGNPMEILMNPAGIPGRVNLGQLLETAAGKVARLKNKPIIIDNFSNKDNANFVRGLLKTTGLTDKETLYDPASKRPIGKVFVGHQYILKLKHQVGTKLKARSRDAYDINRIPQRGGPHGGQSLGSLGIYALLAHGARANLREMSTYKSDFNSDYWNAIQSGEPLPPPKPPFTFDKFMSYLKASGINIMKDGNSLMLSPLTDSHVKQLSSGALPNPSMVIRGKDLAPIKGGLFDMKLTGGPEGTKWAHIQLSEPIPNPIFEGAIRNILGITNRQFAGLVSGKIGVDRAGNMTEGGRVRGGKAFDVLLKKINMDAQLRAAKKAIVAAPAAKVNELNKRIKVLSALKANKLTPSVYMIRTIPVIPPKFRPITRRPDGTINEGDLNGLYKNLSMINDNLALVPKSLPLEEKWDLRTSLYDAAKALTITGTTLKGKEHRGIISIIAGTRRSPKAGFFQNAMIRRRQDMTLRSTIVPEPKLGLDEVGIPEVGAWELYKPFIQRRLRQQGIPPLRALDEIAAQTPQAKAALEHAMEERPIIIKRDPALHKHSVLAFKPILTKGKAVQIHPLVTGGFNADFDGDTMSAYVPITQEAVQEAHDMFPSNNLFSPTTGLLMNKLSHESLLGTFLMSEWGKPSNLKFKSTAEVARAAAQGKVPLTSVVRAGAIRTTPGRILLAEAFPANFTYRGANIRKKLLSDKSFVMDKKQMTGTLTSLAKTDQHDFASTIIKLQNLGTEYTYSTGFSIGLDDIVPFSKGRDRILAVADKKVQKIRQGLGSKLKKDQKAVAIYDKANQDMERAAKIHFDKSGNNIYKMVQSGARGNWDQFRQMVVAPMLVRNAKREIVPVPIKKSYAEGLDTADYWTALHGNREGMIQKVVGTSEPGALSKVVMASTLNMLIGAHDCGTVHGTFMSSADPQILGRHLAQPVKIKNRTIPKGTLVTSDLVTRFVNNRVSKVVVRSPLRCEEPKGLCQMCYGLDERGKLPPIGTNIGAIAGHSIGEPATQLALKAFHTGGVVGAKTTRRTDEFTRVNQILSMPKIMPNASVLSKVTGSISKVEPDPAGGWNVYVGPEKHYIPATRKLSPAVKRGAKLRRGQPLSDGDIHPVELLKLTNINTVQEYLSDELFRAYEPVGPVRKKNIETVVKAITNLGYVEDPGDHPDFARGDTTSISKIVNLNRTVLKGRKPIVFQPILKPIAQLPLDISTDWLAKMNYRRLKDTLVEGAQRGWKTLIHQSHPIPSLAMGSEFGRGTKKEPWLY